MQRALPANETIERPTVVCAWCSALLSRGSDYLSHGICTACCQELMAQLTDVPPAVVHTRVALVGSNA